MNKRKLIALALGALLLLSGGCGLITIDEEKAAAKENAKILIEYKDIDITKKTVNLKMNALLTPQGMTIEDLSEDKDSTSWDSFRKNVLRELAVSQLALDKAKELGLDQLTEDEMTEIDEEYESVKASVESYAEFLTQLAMENDTSLDYDTEYQKQLETYYNMMGYSTDTFRQQIEQDFIVSKVHDYYTKDITVTDEEVRESYDASLSVQKSNIDQSPSTVEMQMSFGAVYYYPEGYMNARHILIKFDDETRSAATAAYSEEDKTEYNRIIEEAKAKIQTKLDDIKTRLADGEDFTTLIDEYNEDYSFMYDPARTSGIVRGPYSNVSIPGYLDALATLKNAGDVTEPFATYDGVYIVQCVKPLAGAVPFEEIKENLQASMLAASKDSEWYKVTQEWVDAAVADGTLKMYPDRY